MSVQPALATSYRFGTGRYLHEENVLELAGPEIARFGTFAFMVAGPTHGTPFATA